MQLWLVEVSETNCDFEGYHREWFFEHFTEALLRSKNNCFLVVFCYLKLEESMEVQSQVDLQAVSSFEADQVGSENVVI